MLSTPQGSGSSETNLRTASIALTEEQSILAALKMKNFAELGHSNKTNEQALSTLGPLRSMTALPTWSILTISVVPDLVVLIRWTYFTDFV
jgi:hypothetical protein